jgi:hypothetical protein
MNRRDTIRKIKKLASKAGSYEAFAVELSTLSDRAISGQGVYQWMLRGKIPKYWWPFVEKLSHD